MSIVKEFEARIEAEQVIGTYKWLQQWTWQEKNKLDKYITDNTKNIEETFSRRQQTMTYLCSHNFRSVLDIKELKIQLSELDEEEIKELISFYNLEKPAQTYKEIKTRINSPESFMTNIPFV